MSVHRSPLRDLVATALWAGIGFGLAEGAFHLVLRAYPALQAAHKLGPAALWITPLGNLVLALPVALLLALLARRWPGLGRPPVAWALSATLGSAAVLRAPEVLHPVTVLLLGAGVGTMAFRLGRASGEAWMPRLRRALPALPVLLLVAFLGTTLQQRLAERERAEALGTAPAGRPDVLILLLDTVRRDRFTGARRLTPVLDSLAARGVTYRNAWAPSSWSLPSQASILTGRHPHQHGANWPTLRLEDSIPTLAEAFRDAGYATGAFSSNHSWVTPEYLGRGFVRFEVYQRLDLWERTAAGRVGSRVLGLFGWRPGKPVLEAPDNIAHFLAFLDEHPARPVFGYLCFMDVNRAFYDRLFAHPAWRPKHTMASAVAAYDSALVALDGEIGALLADLARRDRLQNTVLIVASDHGESFGAEAGGDHDPRGHGTSLHGEQVRVPFFVVAPGVPAGQDVAAATGLVDIPGLALDLAGLTDPRFARGAAVTALRSPATADSVGSAFTTLDYDRFSARSAIRGLTQFLVTRSGAPPGEALFDLGSDSLARASLPTSDPRWDDLRALLLRYDPAALALRASRDSATR